MKTILVVDDELGSAEILAMLLTEEGYATRWAINGAQALAMLRDQVPDIAFIDYMMPQMNGPALIRAMRADSRLKQVKIVLNSGLSEEAIRREFTDYDGFMRKPYKLDEVLEHIVSMWATGPATPAPDRGPD